MIRKKSWPLASRSKACDKDITFNLFEKIVWDLSEEDMDLMDLPVGFIKYNKTK